MAQLSRHQVFQEEKKKSLSPIIRSQQNRNMNTKNEIVLTDGPNNDTRGGSENEIQK